MDWMLTDEEIEKAVGFAGVAGMWVQEYDREVAKAQARKLTGLIKANSKPEHWYGGGWDGLIDKGITDYFIDATILQALYKELGLED